ncbi:SHSA8 protein, partial [Odontophorus gujanensis]|nr:SHSA8 protein [Odontophorus gujanensis]
MVLVGIFTKLGLEKAQGPQTEMTVSRTLTDLLKQPGHGPSEHIDGLMGSMQVQLGEGLPRGPPRNSTDKLPLNNAVDSTGVPSLGHPHGHSKRPPLSSSLSPPAPSYTAYTALTAGGERGLGGHGDTMGRGHTPDDFYMRFGGPEVSPTNTLP